MKTLKINNKDILSAMRFDGSYHISEGTLYLTKLYKMPHKELQQICTRIFTAGRNKRVYTERQFGYPYLSNSDVVKNNPFESCNYNSKKYGEDENAFLKEGMILTGRVGAIGQSSYVTSEMEKEGAMGSDNIIRIVTADPNISGYVYAFFASKYGKTLLERLAAGGVQPYISEEMLKDIPIPILPEATQQKIHNLITEASELRVEANKLLKESVNLLEKELMFTEDDDKFNSRQMTYSVKIGALKPHSQRLDASYNSQWFDNFYLKLKNAGVKLSTITDLSDRVFTPNIFKRVRTDKPELGIPFLSGSDLLSAFPKFDNYLARKMANIDNYILRNGWLAIQDAGTIGYITYIHDYLDGVSATNNLIRIIPKTESNCNPYIYAFFCTSEGQKILSNFAFGSVQKHIDNHQISSLRIPIFDNLFTEITGKVQTAMTSFANACFLEKTAIDLIEKEIDQWQQ